MNIDQKIDKWIDQQGITQGPYRVECNSDKGYCVWGNLPPACSVQIAVCGYGMKTDKANSFMFANARKSLHGWIKVALIEAKKGACESDLLNTSIFYPTFTIATENILASTGKEWSQVREELEAIE